MEELNRASEPLDSVTPQVFIFDFDGIITTLAIDWKKVKKDVEDKTGLSFKGFLDFFESSWGTTRFDEVSRFVARYEREAAGRAALHGDVRETLEFLNSRSCRCYIASMQSRKVLESFIQKNGLGSYFSNIFGREDAGSKKAELEAILSSLEEDLPRKKVVFIDDNRRHMYPCQNLSLTCVHYDRTRSKQNLSELVRGLCFADKKRNSNE